MLSYGFWILEFHWILIFGVWIFFRIWNFTGIWILEFGFYKKGLFHDPVQGGWNKHEHKTPSKKGFYLSPSVAQTSLAPAGDK